MQQKFVLLLACKIPKKNPFSPFSAAKMKRQNLLLLLFAIMAILQFALVNLVKFPESELMLCNDKKSTALQIRETANDNKILSRQKRNFGGKEPIDFPKAFNGTFLVAGWLAQGLEAFSDINFHLLGYTALGKSFTN